MPLTLSSSIKRSKIQESFLPKRYGFGSLSPDLLLNIFKNLNEDDLLNSVIPVCQNWRYVAEDPVLWKQLKFSGKTIDTTTICSKVWQYRNVDRIYLRDISQPITVLRQISRCSENLQHITLRYCSGISEDSLRHLVFTCRNLKTLDLKGTPLKSLIFYQELACAKNLTSINLSENIHLTHSNILTVAVNCRTLNEFHLSAFDPKNKVYLDDSDCYFIISSLVQNIRSISLDCSTLNSYSFSFILKCKHLRELCLNYAYNFEGSLFESIWTSLPHLSSLKIRYGHQITDLNVKMLFENGLDVLEKLQVIDFTGCSKISNEALAAIANCCQKLKTLILRGCKNITNISPILKKNIYLQLLNIAFCENLIIDSLPVPKELNLLFISDNNDLKMLADLVRKKNKLIEIKICVSEFNKHVINYE